MAYVNVAEWSPDRVSEWLKGLDEVILPYVGNFISNQVDGKRLLQLSADTLPALQVTKVGHQEIILQAVELLRNIHYHLNQENVQHLSLRLSSKARSVCSELRHAAVAARIHGGSAGEEDDGEEEEEENGELKDIRKKQERVSTGVIGGVADVLSSVKSLVCWLNRQPFEGQEKYDNIKKFLVEQSIRLATIAHRDKFAENQATLILQLCENLVSLSDKIIQKFDDPLIIQPASLDIATVKKKSDDDWGLRLQSSYHGVHQVSGVIALSPAYQCGKLQEGDELVQVNYQTVVGWNHHRVTAVMEEFPVEVILTVKKRPRHANTVAQIYYLKPMRLPSKKRTYSPWGSMVSSPRYDIQSIPNLQLSVSVDKVAMKREAANTEPTPKCITPPPPQATPSPQAPSSISDAPTTTSDHESEETDMDDDPFLSDGELPGSSPTSMRLYHPKPRVPVQRRATIPGATTRPTLNFDQLLQDMWDHDKDVRRSPSGVNTRPIRPHTCIETATKTRFSRERKNLRKEGVVNEIIVTENDKIDVQESKVDYKPIQFEVKPTLAPELGKVIVNAIPLPPRKPTNHGQLASPAVHRRSMVFDGMSSGGSWSIIGQNSNNARSSTDHCEKDSGQCQEDGQEGRPRRVSEDRPKLDKSHSTPAYDMDGDTEQEGLSTSLANAKMISFSQPSATAPLDTQVLLVRVDPEEIGPAVPLVPAIVSSASTTTTIIITSTIHNTSTTISDTTITTTTTTTSTTTTNDTSNSSSFTSTASYSSEAGEGEREGEQSRATSVVLRETRSSSPSVWRRGVVVSDRGSRRISCRELGQGDHQGWLYRRRDNKSFLISHRWERRWFILKKNYLYGYRDREAVRADSLIYLPGFHVCPATDVKAKKYAFKIYHSSGATFYFACDTSEERSRWMSQMGLSAITSHQQQQQHSYHRHQSGSRTPQQGEEVYYSETDEELEDRSPTSHSLQSPLATKHQSGRDGGGTSLWGGRSTSPSRSNQNWGVPLCSSLAVLSVTKTPSLKFLQPHKDLVNQPVPTASFRSYRRVDGSGTRSTSTGDLRKVNRSDTITDLQGKTEEGRQVTRKNSLRDRLRQFPPFTLDRRRQAGGRSTQENHKTMKKSIEQQQLVGIYQEQQIDEKMLPPSSAITDTVFTTCTTTTVISTTLPITTKVASIPTHTYTHTITSTPILTTTSTVTTTKPINTTLQVIIDPYHQTTTELQVNSSECIAGFQRHRPRYMFPTRASSQYSPARTSFIELDVRNGSGSSKASTERWSTTPPSSGRCSPSKIEINGRRGSVGGESPVRSGSPRRGSLDCLAWPHSRALSPSTSPLHTPIRSSHGSTSSLLASEEYREGSPEKLWISSLRTDTLKNKGTTVRSYSARRDGRSRSGSGEYNASDRLKRTALYHPPFRGRIDPMKPAFELILDPCSGQVRMDHHRESPKFSKTASEPFQSDIVIHPMTTVGRKTERQSPNSNLVTSIRPEVPPRTKFLSLSERTLPSSSSLLPSSPPYMPTASILSSNTVSPTYSQNVTSSLSSLTTQRLISSPSFSPSSSPGLSHSTKPTRHVPNLTIRSPCEETDTVRTPLKPAMGVSMIGKQRRTPTTMSPRDVFFSSPPSSPSLSPVPSSVSQHNANKMSVPAKLRNQKILPHYPGMEYPPVFEPGLYSLCGSSADQTISSSEHDHESITESYISGGDRVIFSVAQDGSHSIPHTSHKLISSLGIHSRTDQVQHLCSTRKYDSSESNMEISCCAKDIGDDCLSHPPLANHHPLNIMGIAQSTSDIICSCDSSHTLYVSAPISGTDSHHVNVTTSSYTHSMASKEQNFYITPSIHSSNEQSICMAEASISSSPLKLNSLGGTGRVVSQYVFRSPDQTSFEQKSGK